MERLRVAGPASGLAVDEAGIRSCVGGGSREMNRFRCGFGQKG